MPKENPAKTTFLELAKLADQGQIQGIHLQAERVIHHMSRGTEFITHDFDCTLTFQFKSPKQGYYKHMVGSVGWWEEIERKRRIDLAY